MPNRQKFYLGLNGRTAYPRCKRRIARLTENGPLRCDQRRLADSASAGRCGVFLRGNSHDADARTTRRSLIWGSSGPTQASRRHPCRTECLPVSGTPLPPHGRPSKACAIVSSIWSRAGRGEQRACDPPLNPSTSARTRRLVHTRHRRRLYSCAAVTRSLAPQTTITDEGRGRRRHRRLARMPVRRRDKPATQEWPARHVLRRAQPHAHDRRSKNHGHRGRRSILRRDRPATLRCHQADLPSAHCSGCGAADRLGASIRATRSRRRTAWLLGVQSCRCTRRRRAPPRTRSTARQAARRRRRKWPARRQRSRRVAGMPGRDRRRPDRPRGAGARVSPRGCANSQRRPGSGRQPPGRVRRYAATDTQRPWPVGVRRFVAAGRAWRSGSAAWSTARRRSIERDRPGEPLRRRGPRVLSWAGGIPAELRHRDRDARRPTDLACIDVLRPIRRPRENQGSWSRSATPTAPSSRARRPRCNPPPWSCPMRRSPSRPSHSTLRSTMRS